MDTSSYFWLLVLASELIFIMYWIYVFMKDCRSTMAEWLHLTFMDWFYVSLKVSFITESGSTLCAWKVLSFMDWFYVCLKVVLSNKCWSTLFAWKLLAFMNWFYVFSNVFFFQWMWFHNACIGTFDLHEPILYDFEGLLLQ